MEKNVNVESCVIYKSYMAAIAELDNDTDKWQILESIINYAFSGTMPELAGFSREQRMIFLMAQPTIDSNRQNRINGARGGNARAVNRKSAKFATTGKLDGNTGKSGGTVYPPLYVPPDDLQRLKMQSLVDDLRRE